MAKSEEFFNDTEKVLSSVEKELGDQLTSSGKSCRREWNGFATLVGFRKKSTTEKLVTGFKRGVARGVNALAPELEYSASENSYIEQAAEDLKKHIKPLKEEVKAILKDYKNEKDKKSSTAMALLSKISDLLSQMGEAIKAATASIRAKFSSSAPKVNKHEREVKSTNKPIVQNTEKSKTTADIRARNDARKNPAKK